MNRTEHLLVCLMEEAAEIQQAASKALRFGLENHHPSSSQTNAQDISKEFWQLIAVADMLETEGDVFTDISSAAARATINAKKVAIDDYMEKAEQYGTLIP